MPNKRILLSLAKTRFKKANLLKLLVFLTSSTLGKHEQNELQKSFFSTTSAKN